MADDDKKASESGFTLEGAPGTSDDESAEDSIPKMDFSTFVISLGTSALYHMGVVAGPEGDAESQKNLPMARQAIDTLEMLVEKTRGNLDAQEDKLLESLLFELRMRFVESEK